MGRYDDMLRLPRPVSKRHPRMTNANRAKQFMPFAALRGYGDALAEKEIRYEARALLSEEDGAALDETLRELSQALRRGERPRITLEVFEPKSGGDGAGQYRTCTGILEKLPEGQGTLRVDGRTFRLEDVAALWREEES